MTYHRSQNYGAQIQAFALKTYLEFLGHEVNVIDYWPDYHKLLYKKQYFTNGILKQYSLPKKIKYICRSLALLALSYVRRYETYKFADKHLNVVPTDCEFGLVIYGSDQIWRKQHADTCESFNPIYFGDERIKTSHRISYAASMGKIEVDEEDIDFLKEQFKRFDAISVRESDLKSLINERIGINPELVCDPTLLLSREQWDVLLPKEPNRVIRYIFMYNLVDVPEIRAIAERLSKLTGMPIVEFRGYVDKVSILSRCRVTASAEDFLYKIRNAEYVVTSSFHGVALSLCFEKQFYFATIKELGNRTESLLRIVNLESRNVANMAAEDIDLKEQIDYLKVGCYLNKFQSSSRSWLCSCLDKYCS